MLNSATKKNVWRLKYFDDLRLELLSYITKISHECNKSP
jgi:hypothetical protein